MATFSRNKHRKRRGLLLCIVVLLGGLLGLGAYGYHSIFKGYYAPGARSEVTTLAIERGTSVPRILDAVSQASQTISPLRLRLAIRFFGPKGSLKAGEYQLEPTMSAADIVGLIISGKSLQHRFTLAEGLTNADVRNLMSAETKLTGSIDVWPSEGALLPDTYAFARGSARGELLGRMQAARTEHLQAQWDSRAPDLPLASPEEALILASIVEKETGRSDERDKVAGVFINRLRRGMRLQSDPTVIYGITYGEPLGRPLSRGDLREKTAFNTYVIDRLPPTPICHPGRASIKAVLNPAETDALFFVADGSGGHAFANTLNEHNRNVRRWRALRREQNR
ncbi:MAG: endolytic transglycosylase MltG [Pseudomonadota bacterium]